MDAAVAAGGVDAPGAGLFLFPFFIPVLLAVDRGPDRCKENGANLLMTVCNFKFLTYLIRFSYCKTVQEIS